MKLSIAQGSTMKTNSYNVISEYEHGMWHGTAIGIAVGVLLTLWIVYGGM